MPGWRETKREARRIVHDTMAIDGQYYAPGSAEPVDARARLGTKFTLIGDDRSMGWAEINAVNPRLIFMIEECRPRRGGIFFIQPGEAYRIEAVGQPDDITITADAVRMTEGQLAQAGLPAAGEAP